MSAPSPPAAAPSVEPQPQLSPGRKSARSLNTFANVRAQQHGTLDARELRRWRYALLHRHSQTPPPTAFSLSSLLPCSPLPFVFLGWSSTGLVLYSYRPGSAVPGSADEVSAAFFLQLWTADPPGPLQLRREVRIWQHSSGAPDDDAAPIEEAHPHIHLLESDDEEVVVVHAFAELVQPYGERGSGAAERREPWPLERHTFTCLTLPSRGPADSSGRELSFSIELRRLTESPPLIAALRRVPPPSSSPSCASYVLLIETEATFWCLHFARSAVHYDAPVTRSSLRSARCSLLQPQSDPAVFGPRSWASWERRGEDSEQAAREDERFGGLKVVMESAFDLEAFIGRLPRVGRGGRLVDYACATLSLTSACVVDPTEARASSPCPLVALLALEQRIDAGLTTTFHFALLALDLVHMSYSWRFVDWPSTALCDVFAPRMHHSEGFLRYFTTVPVLHRSEDETDLRSASTADGPASGSTQASLIVLSRLQVRHFEYVAGHGSLKRMAERVLRRLAAQLRLASYCCAAELPWLTNERVVTDESLTALTHPSSRFAITL